MARTPKVVDVEEVTPPVGSAPEVTPDTIAPTEPTPPPPPQPDEDPIVLRNALTVIYNITLETCPVPDVIARYKAHVEAAKVLGWPISNKAIAAADREPGKVYADNIKVA